ncbi:MAG: RdgB/HAM1 family non-canonical purine NTP pyrophosphatase [Clostridiaceae bacterium]|nr:RdgB/HAM1 family non-canonical purine NTP pyrophosphatase [Eubacteriales bacterium]
MKLIIASNNAHKVAEIKAILAPYFNSIQSLKDARLDIDVVEDGKTFAENALKKAREVLAVSDADAALSDDSGLEVDALFGAPGVYSARYAGEGHDDNANNEKLLQEMKDVPPDKRTCRFVSAVALARREKEPITAVGAVEGKLLYAPRGCGGFGYDPLFLYEPEGMTFAELSAAKKNEISHRACALNALREAMENERA